MIDLHHHIKVIFILLILTNCKKKNLSVFEAYDKYTWKAMVQYKEEDYESALSHFLKGFKIKSDENVSNYFFAAASAFHLNKEELAKELIRQSILKTNASKEYFERFEAFSPFRNSDCFKQIEQVYDSLTKEFFKNLENPEIYHEIDSLLKVDQLVRKNRVAREEMIRKDSQNISRIIEITKQYGWQSRSWLMLWHHRGTYGQHNYVWNFFTPYINTQIEQGKMRKDFWAMFEEHRSIMDKGEQIYGLYSSQMDIFPIMDIENVDERRKTIGHPPLWYMEKVYGIKLPHDYKSDSKLN